MNLKKYLPNFCFLFSYSEDILLQLSTIEINENQTN